MKKRIKTFRLIIISLNFSLNYPKKYYYKLTFRFNNHSDRRNGKERSIFFLCSICKECKGICCSKDRSNKLGSKCKENNDIYSILVSILEHRCNCNSGILDSMLENRFRIRNLGIRGSNDMCKMTFLLYIFFINIINKEVILIIIFTMIINIIILL